MKSFLLLSPLLLLTGCGTVPQQWSYDVPAPRGEAPMAPTAPPPPAPPPAVVYGPEVAEPVAFTPLREDEIEDVYFDVLGRPASDREVWDWREESRRQPFSTESLRRELRESREYHELVPELVIRRAFRDARRPEPTEDEMRYYRRRFIDDRWSAGRVRQSVARREYESAAEQRGSRGSDGDHREHGERGNRGERRSDAGRRDDRSPVAIVQRAYDDLLERRPDADGQRHYVQLLERGASEEEIRRQIRSSEEYRVTLPTAKVTKAYRAVLKRDPDPSGLQTYRKRIVDDGWSEADVERDLRKSAEYRNAHR